MRTIIGVIVVWGSFGLFFVVMQHVINKSAGQTESVVESPCNCTDVIFLPM